MAGGAEQFCVTPPVDWAWFGAVEPSQERLA